VFCLTRPRVLQSHHPQANDAVTRSPEPPTARGLRSMPAVPLWAPRRHGVAHHLHSCTLRCQPAPPKRRATCVACAPVSVFAVASLPCPQACLGDERRQKASVEPLCAPGPCTSTIDDAESLRSRPLRVRFSVRLRVLVDGTAAPAASEEVRLAVPRLFAPDTPCLPCSNGSALCGLPSLAGPTDPVTRLLTPPEGVPADDAALPCFRKARSHPLVVRLPAARAADAR